MMLLPAAARQIGSYSFKRHEGELRDYVSITTRAHTLKFGGRLRWPTSPHGRQTILAGRSSHEPRSLSPHAAARCHPGSVDHRGWHPFAEVKQWDIGPSSRTIGRAA